MARRREHEEHVNHERWLVSYADFITLLFAFFVVMYAISSVNEGKYRVLSGTLMEAFSNPETAEKPIVIERQGAGNNLLNPGPANGTLASTEQMQEMAEKISASLRGLETSGMLKVTATAQWVEVDIKSQFLFGSGSAQLAADAIPVLRHIASEIAKFDNPVHIEGHTDNVPIVSTAYPSNWHLSAARAVAVVDLFALNGVAASRMAAVGYGEFQPVADNSSDAGRNRNRRVVIIISRDGNVRDAVNVDHRAEGNPVTAAESVQTNSVREKQ